MCETPENSPHSLVKPTWMARLYSDDAYEVIAENNFGPILLVPNVGRSIIWQYCNELLGEEAPVGIAGQACHILERYLATLFTKNMYVEIRSVEWQTTKAELTKKLQLFISVCIQLATKMLSATDHLYPLAVKRYLQDQQHLTYTIQEIIAAESEIFQSIEFRIPLWTNVEKAQLVAQTLNSSRICFDGVVLVMDLVEYHRRRVQEKVRQVAFENPSASTSRDNDDSTDPMANIRSMYMVAGVVVATWRFFNEQGPDPLARLAAWMRSTETYIGCICNVIMEHIMGVSGTSYKRSSSFNNMESLRRKRQRFF